jgi:mono/diheme cytochrome c family protein|tara:strand:+ start:42 stop:359 length:318 start_codon:yes stop_codon:yes gene_type:complete
MKLVTNFLIIYIFLTTSSFSNEEMLKKGEQIFYGKASCYNCHMLNAADGNKRDMNVKRVVEVVTHGYGVMPAYKNVLSKEDIIAVATYISKVSKNWKNKLSSFVQ